MASPVSIDDSQYVVQIRRHQDNQERRAIVDWLSSTDFPAQQSDLIRKCQEGTGQWLINCGEYKTWLREAGKMIFCPGMPGSGKTMISALVIDHLSKKFEAEGNIGIVFIYCNYNRQQEQKLGNLLATMLKQLVQDQDSLPEEVRNLYKRHIDKRTRPSDDELRTALRSAIGSFDRTFLVCDALDECSDDESIRTKLLDAMFELQRQFRTNVFATSRSLPEVVAAFRDELSVEIRATEDDVRRYLEARIVELPKCVGRNQNLREEIINAISDAVGGMYVMVSS